MPNRQSVRKFSPSQRPASEGIIRYVSWVRLVWSHPRSSRSMYLPSLVFSRTKGVIRIVMLASQVLVVSEVVFEEVLVDLVVVASVVD